MFNKTKTTLALLPLIFTLAGCSGAPDTNVPDGISVSYDPCTLLTADDVLSIFPGGTIVNTKHDTVANTVGQKICFYSADDADMKFVQLSIITTGEINGSARAGGQSAENMFKGNKAFIQNPEAVTGLGDEAYYGGSGLGIGKGISVLVKNKEVTFTIDMGLGFGNTDKDAHVTKETELAKKVISRL